MKRPQIINKMKNKVGNSDSRVYVLTDKNRRTELLLDNGNSVRRHSRISANSSSRAMNAKTSGAFTLLPGGRR